MEQKFLVITRKNPSPDTGGAAMRVHAIVQGLKRIGDVGVVWIDIDASTSKSQLEGVRYWKHVPVPIFPFGWLRMLKGFVTCTPCSSLFWTKRAKKEVATAIHEMGATTVIIEELWLAPYMALARAMGCRTVLDMHNAETLLYGDIVKSSRGWRRIHALLLMITAKRIEHRAIRQADRVWVCSDEDAAICKNVYGTKIAPDVIPNVIDTNRYDLRHRIPSPPNILFCGNYLYYPNLEAAMVFIEEFMPLLWKDMPEVCVHLVGAFPSWKMQSAAKKDARINVTGFVANLAPWLQKASVTVMPIQHGGGTRLKVLEAFAAGIPVVATGKAVEGLDATPDVHYLRGDDAASLVTATLQLLKSKNQGEMMKHAARAHVEQYFSQQVVTEAIRRSMDSMQS
jgi:glycosyltransferase involved in cell wall biosynthesis